MVLWESTELGEAAILLYLIFQIRNYQKKKKEKKRNGGGGGEAMVNLHTVCRIPGLGLRPDSAQTSCMHLGESLNPSEPQFPIK